MRGMSREILVCTLLRGGVVRLRLRRITIFIWMRVMSLSRTLGNLSRGRILAKSL